MRVGGDSISYSKLHQRRFVAICQFLNKNLVICMFFFPEFKLNKFHEFKIFRVANKNMCLKGLT